MSRILIFLIRIYQKVISPVKPYRTCRFNPTCSQYFIEALIEWGFFCGTALGIWRIMRCNPFGKSGYDPVPRRKKNSRLDRIESEKAKRGEESTESEDDKPC